MKDISLSAKDAEDLFNSFYKDTSGSAGVVGSTTPPLPLALATPISSPDLATTPPPPLDLATPLPSVESATESRLSLPHY